MDSETEIYQRVIPGGLDEFDDLNAKNQVTSKAAAVGIAAVGMAVDTLGELPSPPIAQPGVDTPDDFCDGEPEEALGFS